MGLRLMRRGFRSIYGGRLVRIISYRCIILVIIFIQFSLLWSVLIMSGLENGPGMADPIQVVPIQPDSLQNIVGNAQNQTINSKWTSRESYIRQSLTVRYRPKIAAIYGTPRKHRGFLTIGVPSMNRKVMGSQYLKNTVSSLLFKMSHSERDRVTILIYLADFDKTFQNDVITYFTKYYVTDMNAGLILIISADVTSYPPLVGIQRNYNDSEERVKWRAKQVVDYAFMFHYGQNISEYYIQIEDDVIAAKDYVVKIEDFIKEQKEPWVTLQFSLLGFIGKLYRSSDLPLLYDFLMLFYDQMPVDWLYEYFAKIMARPEMPLRKPTLFQHKGRTSSFPAKDEVKLYDGYFEDDLVKKELGDNPPARLCTDLLQYQDKAPSMAYNTSWPFQFFWGTNIFNGTHFSLMFDSPQHLSEVQVISGHSFRKEDIIRDAVLEFGFLESEKNPGNCSCDHYQVLGSFNHGKILISNKNVTFINPVSCVRVRFTKLHSNWVILYNIIVRTLKQATFL